MLKYHRPTPGSRGLNLNASSTCARRRQYRVDFWSRALSADTPYRALLDAKIAPVGVMIALALFNRFRLAPRDLRNRSRARDRRGRPGQRARAADPR
jgi:hypothetical protein